MRGVAGTQSTGLPRLHARGADGKPLCRPRPRKHGHVMAQRPEEADCKRCRAVAGKALLTPTQAHRFVQREEARMREESRREFEPLDPFLADKIRQVVKVAGVAKVRRLLDEIEWGGSHG